MENKGKIWAEIDNSRICGDLDGMYWCIDARKTDNGEGTTVAYIDDLTGKVIYADPRARTDEQVQAAVRDRLADLSDNFLWTVAAFRSDGNGIRLERKAGTKEEIRSYLFQMATSDLEEAAAEGHELCYSPKTAEDIHETDGGLYACSSFFDLHIEYVAKPDFNKHYENSPAS